MIKNDVSRNDLSELLDISYNTVSARLNGKESSFSIEQAFKIRDAFFPNATIEYLFKKFEA
jgi:plasmid maintenance system antidote protein VapI